jgi:flagellar protein FlbD
MIQLTRLNNQGLLVNCDLIKFVETAPDTVLTLTSGEKIVVREGPEEVMERIIQFKRLVLEHRASGERETPRLTQSPAELKLNVEQEAAREIERGPDRG